MESEEFRRLAHVVADWMADYLRDIGDYPVMPGVQPGATGRQLPAVPPATGERIEAILDDFKRIILPGMSHWNHPGWFAYFPATTSPPSVLAEMLTAALAANCMSWQTSPAATELEQVMMRWLGGTIGLPESFTGVIQDTASTATLVALICARERASGGAFGSKGPAAAESQRLTVYTSQEAHSSVPKGVRLAGFGSERLRLIPVDADYAMRPDALDAAIQRDLGDGLLPACIVATTGTTSSTALDPLRPLGEIARRHGAWLHVDAAYAGAAAILPERRAILDGVELADSFVFNPHKWLLTNFDCSAFFVRDPQFLIRIFGTSPEYLRGSHDAEVVNYRDWGIPLGRRFRALKLWFVLRSYGVEGLQEIIRSHIALADDFRGWVEADPDWEPMAPSPLALVCFRYRPSHLGPDDPRVDHLNRRILAIVNGSERVHLTPTILGGRYVLRLVPGALATRAQHVAEAWDLLRTAAREQTVV